MGLVFLAHNSRDKDLVENFAHALRDRGIEPWLDKWNLIPGEPWLPKLESAIRESRAVCVCVGPHGLSSVHSAESNFALTRAFEEPTRLVIPVLLEGAPDLRDTFLADRTWIDLRKHENVAAGLAELERALQGRAAGPSRRSQTAACPYRGLEAFDEKHAQSFFGRAAHVVELLEVLRTRRLLTLVGPSGCGKSSLVLAGLVPAIRTGQLDGDASWSVVRLRPEAGLLRMLALCAPTVDGLEAKMRENDSALADGLDREAAARGFNAKTLLIVDQLEEVFTQSKKPGLTADDDGHAFLRNVLHAGTIDGGRTTVVLTLRADFLAPFLADERLSSSIEFVVRMRDAELHDAIARPLAPAGATIEPALIRALLEAVEGQAGELPLLQFGLQRLWETAVRDRRGRDAPIVLSTATLHAMGGLRDAIAHHAEAQIEALDASSDLSLVRKIFGMLVKINDGAPDTRRRASRKSLEALSANASALIDRFVRARLLAADDGFVELAHDALIEKWSRLRDWVLLDQRALRVQQELDRRALQWDSSADAGDLLRGARLREIEELRDSGDIVVVDRALALVQASTDARSAQLERERREAKRLRLGATALGALLLGLIAASVTALDQRDRTRSAIQKLKEIDSATEKLGEELSPIPGAAAPWRRFGSKVSSGWSLELRGEGESSTVAVERRFLAMIQRGDRALEYVKTEEARTEYEGALALARSPASMDRDEAQAHVCRALKELGLVARFEQNFEEARRRFSEALAVCRDFAEQAPADAERRRAVSALLGQLADMALELGDEEESRVLLEEALELAQSLFAQHPENTRYERLVAVSLGRLGDLDFARGDRKAARERFEAGLVIARRLDAQDGDNDLLQNNISSFLERIGGCALADGDNEEAREKQREALVLRRLLAANQPNSLSCARGVAVALGLLAEVAVAEAHRKEARELLREALAITQNLRERDPTNAGHERDLVFILEDLGDLERAEGNNEVARRRFEEALAVWEIRAARNPKDAETQRALSFVLGTLGDLARHQKNGEEARRRFDRALSIARRLAEQHPEWLRSHERLASALISLGFLEWHEGNRVDARKRFEEELLIRKRLAAEEPESEERKRDLLRSHDRVLTLSIHLEDSARAKVAVEELRAWFAHFDEERLFENDADVAALRASVEKLDIARQVPLRRPAR